MFLTTRTLRRLHEQHVEDLKEAHARTVTVLAEQIEYLRAELGRPILAARQPLNPAEQPAMESGLPAHVSEEEEDLLALHEEGHLTDFELEQALAAAGFRKPTD